MYAHNTPSGFVLTCSDLASEDVMKYGDLYVKSIHFVLSSQLYGKYHNKWCSCGLLE
jgi:hypothetical protein